MFYFCSTKIYLFLKNQINLLQLFEGDIMGCTGSKEAGDNKEAPKEYSWDKQKAQFNAQDFIVSKKNGDLIIKEPGSVNGQQFIIEDCVDCDIFVCDYSASVTIDNCTNCRIFVGPVESSIFVRNCKNCKCIIACQQWRTRECENLDVFLYSMTQPIIESSTNMRFACFQFYYPALLEQFTKAKLNVFNNSWGQVYDFTPSENQGGNWSYLPLDVKHTQFFKTLPPNILPEADANKNSVVPLTNSNRPRPSAESCFVVFFNDHKVHVLDFASEIQAQQGSNVVIKQTREAALGEAKAREIFNNSDQIAKLAGNIVGLEVTGGNDVTDVVRAFSENFVKKLGNVPDVLYISPSTEIAQQQLGRFFEAPGTIKSM